MIRKITFNIYFIIRVILYSQIIQQYVTNLHIFHQVVEKPPILRSQHHCGGLYKMWYDSPFRFSEYMRLQWRHWKILPWISVKYGYLTPAVAVVVVIPTVAWDIRLFLTDKEVILFTDWGIFRRFETIRDHDWRNRRRDLIVLWYGSYKIFQNMKTC